MHIYTFFIACVLASISGAFMLALMDSNHNWGGDFSQYIAQAQALINGTIPTQIANNTLMMSLNDFPYGPNVYPWGYPLLLAPVLAIFGENLAALKCVNIALFSLFIICFYCYVARRFSMGASITLTRSFRAKSYAFILCKWQYPKRYCLYVCKLYRGGGATSLASTNGADR